MELRAFARAHAALEAASRDGREVQATPMMKRVVKLQFELMQRR
jgi:hypothetical protein